VPAVDCFGAEAFAEWRSQTAELTKSDNLHLQPPAFEAGASASWAMRAFFVFDIGTHGRSCTCTGHVDGTPGAALRVNLRFI